MADEKIEKITQYVAGLDEAGKREFLTQVSAVAKAAGDNVDAKAAAAKLPEGLAAEHVDAVKHAAGLATDKAKFDEFAKSAGLADKAFEDSIKTIVAEIKPKLTEEQSKLLKEVGEKGVKEAEEAFNKMGKVAKFVGTRRVLAPSIAGAATLVSLAIPNKQEEVTQPDGTTATEEHWGAGKKVAFGTGAVVTGVTLAGGHKWGRTIKIAEAQAAKMASEGHIHI